MTMTLRQIAELVGGTLARDGQTEIVGFAGIDDAGPGEITFAKNENLAGRLQASSAAAALVPEKFPAVHCPVIHVQDVEQAFLQVVLAFKPRTERPPIGISSAAHISPTARLAEDVNVYPGAYIGDHVVIGRGTTVHCGVRVLEHCHLGEDVTLFPNAVLYDGTVVGDRSIIHAGAILGAYGFGYQSDASGHRLSPQLGHVEIGCDVEIGAATTIDRGTFTATRVGDGTKIDNQVMIGHNCQIGRHNLLCSQVGIAGSCRTGDFVTMAGQVGVGDHLTIGDHVTLGAKSGVMHNLAGNQVYLGSPAIAARDFLQIVSAQSKLPQMRKQFKQLEKRVDAVVPPSNPRSRAA